MTRLMPASVSTGINAFLNACLAMTRDSGRPLRRASLMYSEPRTSRIEGGGSRMGAGAKNQPGGEAGQEGGGAGAEPDDGSHPRYTEKNKISTRPTQNEGSESPSNANTLPALSQKRPTRTAARMPLGMPIRREKAMAAVARSSELGRRDR